MPGKHVNGIEGEACRRCKENPAVINVRSEPLCRDDFIRYVNTKAIKRMESFGVRYSDPNKQRKFLFPVSFGVSSITLLNILDKHLKTQQAKTGRTGFALIVLFVDTRSIDNAGPTPDHMKELEERFPGHQYSSVPLQDVFSVVPADDSLFDLVPRTEVARGAPALDQLSAFMNSLTSASARADVVPILKTRLIVEEAKRLGCEGILWGDSTTKLASKTLAETAKGRGFSLPWQIADGESPFGLTFNYPLRDVLKKELVAYVDLLDLPLFPLVHESTTGATQAPMSSKNTTIDDLMNQYFETVEQNLPAIVSNVVRTSTKLEAKTGSDSGEKCSLCSMPVADGRFGIHGWGGDQAVQEANTSKGSSQRLCYGCTRSMPRTA